jgi:hypothetical protein
LFAIPQLGQKTELCPLNQTPIIKTTIAGKIEPQAE